VDEKDVEATVAGVHAAEDQIVSPGTGHTENRVPEYVPISADMTRDNPT
jgi:hypothetical protein